MGDVVNAWPEWCHPKIKAGRDLTQRQMEPQPGNLPPWEFKETLELEETPVSPLVAYKDTVLILGKAAA